MKPRSGAEQGLVPSLFTAAMNAGFKLTSMDTRDGMLVFKAFDSTLLGLLSSRKVHSFTCKD